MLASMEKTPLTIFREMKLFIIVWVGQLIASIGSSITAFALDVWVYEHTGSVTQFAFITLTNTLPLILLAPIAGLLVDRWERRWTMIICNFGNSGDRRFIYHRSAGSVAHLLSQYFQCYLRGFSDTRFHCFHHPTSTKTAPWSC